MESHEKQRFCSIIESLIFASEKPITLKEIQTITEIKEKAVVSDIIHELQTLYNDPARGVELVEVAEGFQFRTKPDNAQWVNKLFKEKKFHISRASLDTLAIISYKQPVTRAEVEKIRGVDSSGVLKMLLIKNLVKIVGKSKEPGCPLIYGTTPYFLEVLGINSLSDLPPLKEFSKESLNIPGEDLVPAQPEQTQEAVSEKAPQNIIQKNKTEEPVVEKNNNNDATQELVK